MFILCRNLSKTNNALNLDNIDQLNRLICEKPSLLIRNDTSWKTIETSLKRYFDNENEIDGNN